MRIRLYNLKNHKNINLFIIHLNITPNLNNVAVNTINRCITI